MNRSGLVGVAVLLLVSASAAVAADSARERLEKYLESAAALRTEFSQTLLDEQGRTIETTTGTLYLERPRHFRWDYKEPYEQSIIGDGEQVWIYDPELEQVTVQPMATSAGSTPIFLLAEGAELDTHFEAVELGEIAGLRWLSLAPRDPETQFATIRLGFDEGGLRIMELADNLGQTTHLEFSGEQRDQSFAPGLFQFTPPEGVDVFDGTNQL